MNKEKPSRFSTILGSGRFRLFAIIAAAIVVLGIALFFVFRGGDRGGIPDRSGHAG